MQDQKKKHLKLHHEKKRKKIYNRLEELWKETEIDPYCYQMKDILIGFNFPHAKTPFVKNTEKTIVRWITGLK